MARTAKKAPEEHPFYHDTWKLLKNYRDVAWNLEIADLDLQAEMRAEYGTAEGGSLAALTEAGADLHGTRIESFARSLERSRKMMRLLDAAIQLMRRRHKKGSVRRCWKNWGYKGEISENCVIRQGRFALLS